MSKRMSVAVMAVTVLVFIAACGSNATPMPTPASPAATHTPSTATPTVSDPDSVQATLLRHQERWERSGITDYDYTGACGGTVPAFSAALRSYGLSPRVRGNRLGTHAKRCRKRSIPARAGEPRDHPPSPHSGSVYPRACGGTFLTTAPCASARVYPRACGGTIPSFPGPGQGQGLLRGNQGSTERTAVRSGSIPARAGEPRPIIEELGGLSPRVRGNP